MIKNDTLSGRVARHLTGRAVRSLFRFIVILFSSPHRTKRENEREELKDYNHNENGKMWHSRSYFFVGQNDGGACCIIVLDTNHYQ